PGPDDRAAAAPRAGADGRPAPPRRDRRGAAGGRDRPGRAEIRDPPVDRDREERDRSKQPEPETPSHRHRMTRIAAPASPPGGGGLLLAIHLGMVLAGFATVLVGALVPVFERAFGASHREIAPLF